MHPSPSCTHLAPSLQLSPATLAQRDFCSRKTRGVGKHIVTLLCSLWVSTSTGGLWLCQAPWTPWWPSAVCPCCHWASWEPREGCLALGEGPCEKGMNYSSVTLVQSLARQHGARLRGSPAARGCALHEDLAAACRDAGHVLEAVAGPGLPPGMASVFGVNDQGAAVSCGL